jgi:hypothetical protein
MPWPCHVSVPTMPSVQTESKVIEVHRNREISAFRAIRTVGSAGNPSELLHGRNHPPKDLHRLKLSSADSIRSCRFVGDTTYRCWVSSPNGSCKYYTNSFILGTIEIWRLRTRIELTSFEVNKPNLIGSSNSPNLISKCSSSICSICSWIVTRDPVLLIRCRTATTYPTIQFYILLNSTNLNYFNIKLSGGITRDTRSSSMQRKKGQKTVLVVDWFILDWCSS